MWAVVFMGSTKVPRVMSIHRSQEVAEETAAWTAYAGCPKESVHKDLHYDAFTEMPWSEEHQMYLIRHGLWSEMLWVIEVERRA